MTKFCRYNGCNGEVIDTLTNLCREHLLEDIEFLKRNANEWRRYFKSGSNRKPFKHPGLSVDEIQERVIGWTTFQNQQYKGRGRK